MPEKKQRVYDLDNEPDEMLLERADAAWRLLRSADGIDPYEALISVVWPSPEMIEAQLLVRAERLDKPIKAV